MQNFSNVPYADDELALDAPCDSSYLKILDGLNDSQKEAVSAPLCNMLIIAGAGTGKTRVLVSRIAWLMKKEGIGSRNILAVTFTNKAATEMRERIASMVGYEEQRFLWASTFHSTCLRLLRAYAAAAGLRPGFTILDQDSQKALIKRIMVDKNIDIKVVKPADVLNTISKLKEKGIRAHEFRFDSSFGRSSYFNDVKSVYTAYEKICNQENSVDFSELLLRTVELLENNADIRELQHQRFKEILVDEFQDTNSIQYRFLRLITGKNSHVTAVGDDDQSIYGWRGADYTNMHRFIEDFPEVKQVLLALNYRSSQRILDMANVLISSNEDRLMEKVLKGNSGDGDEVMILNCATDRVEADTTIKTIKELHEEGESYRDMAILYRNNYLSLGFEQLLAKYNIPFTIYGGQKFFERAEILDALAYLRVLVNEDDDTATLRIINVPSRKIGAKVISDIRTICNERNCSVIKAIRLLTQYSGPDRVLNTLKKKVSAFYELIASLQKLSGELELYDLVDTMLTQSGLYDYYQAKDEKEGRNNEEHSRVGNLGMLLTNIKDFIEQKETLIQKEKDLSDVEIDEENDLLNYLSSVTLTASTELSENGEETTVADTVNMMTIHSSKGLEFKYVFLVGFESDIIPSKRSMDNIAEGGISEERRLAYVGITRAKQRLYISYAQRRRFFGDSQATGASFFLREIVKNYRGKDTKPYVIIQRSAETYF